LLSLLIIGSGTASDTVAVDEFEYVGGGLCAVTADCGSSSCKSSYFLRWTDSAHRSTNLEACAADALQAGAQGFFVTNSGSACYLVPKQDPGLSDFAYCPSSSTCPARSPYGSYSSYDWIWFENAGVGPILGVWPSSSYSCYRLKVPTETEVPTENPTEAPVADTCSGVTAYGDTLKANGEDQTRAIELCQSLPQCKTRVEKKKNNLKKCKRVCNKVMDEEICEAAVDCLAQRKKTNNNFQKCKNMRGKAPRTRKPVNCDEKISKKQCTKTVDCTWLINTCVHI